MLCVCAPQHQMEGHSEGGGGGSPKFTVGLIADIQYSTAPDADFPSVVSGQIAWALSNPSGSREWPLTYNWPSTRRYQHSLEVLRRALAFFSARWVGHAVVLGDLLDKTAIARDEVDSCLRALKAAFQGAALRYHYLFGNGDAQILKRAGWVAHGFAGPGCTAARLYYSAAPTPGLRLLFLDTFDVSAGQPARPAPTSATPRQEVECEASSEEAHAAAVAHLAANPLAAAPWGAATWREYPNRVPGHALEEAYASQAYNGGVGAAQMAWMEGELAAAQAAGEAVFVFGHCPAHPWTAKPDGLMWRAAALRAALERCPAVQAYIAGHDHDGGYFCSEAGVHYLVPPAPLESEEDNCFGALVFGEREWELEWHGKTPPAGCGTLRGGAWPSGRAMPYRALDGRGAQ